MKICLITNFASHYREEIYTLIDSELQCDFVFGDTLNNGIKSFDLSGFRNHVQILRNIQKGEVTLWQRGVLKKLFENYDAYFVADDVRCLSTWCFLILSKLMGRKVYFWAHGWYGRESFAKRCLKKIFYRFPKGIFLYGNYSRGVMIDNGFSPDNLWVIHNSLAYSKQMEVRSKLQSSDIYEKHFSNNDPTLIFIGRLTSSKKLHMIINSMKELQDRFLNCNLVFVGAGPVKDELEECVRENGLSDRVWFYGPCYDEYMNAELIYNADVCVSPGNIGLTAIHVMTFGTPAITHDCFKYQGPEFEAIKPGITGDFFEYGNQKSLTDKVQAWLNYSKDRREDVRNACYNEVDSSWTPSFQVGIIKEYLK